MSFSPLYGNGSPSPDSSSFWTRADNLGRLANTVAGSISNIRAAFSKPATDSQSKPENRLAQPTLQTAADGNVTTIAGFSIATLAIVALVAYIALRK